MRHSQKVHDAMQKVFDKLLVLTPQELSEILEKREIGPIGHLMRETGTMDALYEQNNYSVHSLIRIESLSSHQKNDGYIISNTEDDWLEAA
ncbi:hypothetical protein QUF76_06445 [Desulfobacterales bacterium HSG16]|nr:hypothetical protein [Desulfobacterales bacterium HSG16]